jgi:transposase
MVRVPSLSEEDARQLHRTLDTIQQDRTRLINRLKGLLATQGVQLAVNEDFRSRLETARLWDGTPLPNGLKQRLMRVWAQLEFLNTQRAEAEEARAALECGPQTATGRSVEQLQTLRAIGPTGAWVLTTEIFGWRQIRNGRQLGALVGLVPAPYQSGETSRDQGITRAGNKRVRRITVQLAWNWVRYQPASALTRWYQRRFGGAGGRMRRIGIVALARKLLIALWRYLDTGAVPDGAALKA